MPENEQISRCPVCGKLPKCRFSGFNIVEYPTCDIYCKPLFKKAHLGVTYFILGSIIRYRVSTPLLMETAKKEAIKLWNKKAKEANNDGE